MEVIRCIREQAPRKARSLEDLGGLAFCMECGLRVGLRWVVRVGGKTE